MKPLFVFAIGATLLLSLLALDSLSGEISVKALNLDKLNTDADEVDPFVTADGGTFYYGSNKAGTFDILVSKKTAKGWPAGKPVFNGKDEDERSPMLWRNRLFFATNLVPDEKLKDLKNYDIMQKFGDSAPVPVPGISEKEDELHPWVTQAGKEFYFSRKTTKGWMQFVAQGPDFGPIGNAKEVGFALGFHHASVSPSGLILYLQGPVDGDRVGLFRSRRAKLGAPWSMPEPLAALNQKESKRGDLSPCLAGDRLYFVSDRTGSKGGLDLWSVLAAQIR